MTDEEIYKIILQVQGADEVKRLAAEIAKEEKAIRDATAALKAGTIGHAQFEASARAAAAQAGKLGAELKQAEAALHKAGGGAKGAGQALSQAGYAVDDLQYGFRGIANNIQPILSSIPALAKLAGPISIAAIAAFQLYEHWDQLAGLFGQGHVKTQAEEMEELRKKTSHTADEAERLARAQNLEGKVKELRAAKTKDQKSEEGAATEAMVEAGAGNVARGIRKVAPELIDSQGDAAGVVAKIAGLEKEVAEYQERSKGADQGESAGQTAIANQAEIDRLKRDELEPARKATAEKIAATGALPAEWAGQRGRIAAMARKDPAAFGGGDERKGMAFAASMEAADPEAQKQKAADDHGEKDDRENADRRERWREAGRISDEEEEKASDDHLKQQQQDFARRKADWDYETPEEQEKARGERNKAADRQVDAAKANAPGIEGLIRAQLKAMIQGGADPMAAQSALVDGLKGTFGAGTTTRLVADQLGGAREEAVSDYLNGDDKPQPRNSQVIDSTGLADSIQAAVGGQDTGKQQVDQLMRVNELLGKYLSRGDDAPGPIIRR